MASIGDIFLSLRADSGQFEADVTKAAGAAGDKAGGIFSASFAKKFALGAIVGAFGLATKGALELDTATRNAAAAMGLAESEMAGLQSRIVDLFKANPSKGFAEIADTIAALKTDMGLSAEQAGKAAEAFLDFSKIAGTDGVTAVKGLDAALDVFDLEASESVRVMDLLVASQQRYGGTLQQRLADLQTIGPALTGLNLTIEDAIGLENLFEQAGLDAGSAQRALNTAIKNIKPGQSFDDLIRQVSAIEDPTKRAKKAIELFGQQGAKLGVLFRPGIDAVDDFTVSMAEAADATSKGADIMDNSFSNQITGAIRQVTGTLAQLGAGAGPILTATGGILSLVPALTAAGLSMDAFRTKAAGVLPVLARFGPAGIAAAAGIVGIVDQFGKLQSAIELFNQPAGPAKTIAILDQLETEYSGLLDILPGVREELLRQRLEAEFGSDVAAQLADAWRNVNPALSELTTGALPALGSAFDQTMTIVQAKTRAAALASDAMTRSLGKDMADATGVVRKSGIPDAVQENLVDPFEQGRIDSIAALRAAVDGWVDQLWGRREELATGSRSLADDIYTPLLLAGQKASVEAEINSSALAKSLRSKDPEIKADAERRVLELRQQLASINADLTKYGDEASRIARLKAQLTSDEMIAGLKSRDEAVRVAAERQRRQIEGELILLATNAEDWGRATGNAYVDGFVAAMIAEAPRITDELTEIRRRMEAHSPPGPASPLHGIDTWGRQTGLAWVDALVEALARTPGRITSVLGGVPAALAIGEPAIPAREPQPLAAPLADRELPIPVALTTPPTAPLPTVEVAAPVVPLPIIEVAGPTVTVPEAVLPQTIIAGPEPIVIVGETAPPSVEVAAPPTPVPVAPLAPTIITPTPIVAPAVTVEPRVPVIEPVINVTTPTSPVAAVASVAEPAPVAPTALAPSVSVEPIVPVVEPPTFAVTTPVAPVALVSAVAPVAEVAPTAPAPHITVEAPAVADVAPTAPVAQVALTAPVAAAAPPVTLDIAPIISVERPETAPTAVVAPVADVAGVAEVAPVAARAEAPAVTLDIAPAITVERPEVAPIAPVAQVAPAAPVALTAPVAAVSAVAPVAAVAVTPAPIITVERPDVAATAEVAPIAPAPSITVEAPAVAEIAPTAAVAPVALTAAVAPAAPPVTLDIAPAITVERPEVAPMAPVAAVADVAAVAPMAPMAPAAPAVTLDISPVIAVERPEVAPVASVAPVAPVAPTAARAAIAPPAAVAEVAHPAAVAPVARVAPVGPPAPVAPVAPAADVAPAARVAEVAAIAPAPEPAIVTVVPAPVAAIAPTAPVAEMAAAPIITVEQPAVARPIAVDVAAPTVAVSPGVTVEAPAISVAAPAAPIVNVAATPSPNVIIEAPAAPTVNVAAPAPAAAPVVDVAAPAPIVLPPPAVNVAVPPVAATEAVAVPAPTVAVNVPPAPPPAVSVATIAPQMIMVPPPAPPPVTIEQPDFSGILRQLQRLVDVRAVSVPIPPPPPPKFTMPVDRGVGEWQQMLAAPRDLTEYLAPRPMLLTPEVVAPPRHADVALAPVAGDRQIGPFNIYNPAPEPASQSIEERLRIGAATGVFGG